MKKNKYSRLDSYFQDVSKPPIDEEVKPVDELPQDQGEPSEEWKKKIKSVPGMRHGGGSGVRG